MQNIAIGLIVLSIGLACLFAAGIVLHRPKKGYPPPLTRYPPVSVLVTLRNMDDGLEENLESVFASSYPDFTVLLAVDTMQDPCVAAVERVRARFTAVPSEVIAAGHSQTSNPKISKLAQLERCSSAELFWVLDSDIRVAPGTLTALVHEHITRDAAIVFSPIHGRGARTFGSLLEMSYINFYLSGSVVSAWGLLRQRVIVGKSLLIDRHAIDQFGGFSYFADVLAEDHWLGEAFARSGFPVRCNYTWVDNIKETSTVKTFFDRIVRWAKLRYHLKRPVFLLEVLLNPLALVILCIPVLGASALPLAGIVVLVRIALEYLVLFAVGGPDRKRASVLLSLPAAVVVKDLLMMVMYVTPFFSSSISWRGGRIRIGRDTLIPTVTRAGFSTEHNTNIVVSVLMGLGHLRAAEPLKHLSTDGVLVYGSRDTTPPSEYRLWHGIRRSYYFFSQAGNIPAIGAVLLRLLVWVQRIKPYYPRRDRSKPTAVVRYLDYLIRKRGLCGGLIEKIKGCAGPVIHTYFATALALDKKGDPALRNYLLICDSDFNRVWVPPDPRRSSLRYLAPCAQVKHRLLSYGVPEERIFLTGFPLPRENIGTEAGLEILKKDLFMRLVRLDPADRFFWIHSRSVAFWLDQTAAPPSSPRFTVTFAIGGSGAQAEFVFTILKSLRNAVREGKIRIIVSVGILKRIVERIFGYIHRLGLSSEMGRGVLVLFDLDPSVYFDRFNACLRQTDVLWTKPSELVFYSALGLPIIMAPAIGTHEELNKRWLQELHAGINPPGPLECCHEWLFDLYESGSFAEAAWDGFLKGRKLGTYKIERLIRDGTFDEGQSPLEQ